MLTLLLVLSLNILISYGSYYWIKPDLPLLPRNSRQMAVGFYNHSIFLLGGKDSNKSLIKYNTINNEMADLGEFYLPLGILGLGQYYTQRNDELIMAHTNGIHLYSFNLHDKSFNNQWNNAVIPDSVSHGSAAILFGTPCLASTDDHLFVVGGSESNNLQILAIQTNIWLSNVPTMNEKRTFLSCVIGPDNYLYAIGGFYSYFDYTTYIEYYLKSIEKIDISSIATIQALSWDFIPSLLLHNCSSTRAVIYNDNIWVIGGYSTDNWQDINAAHWINEVQVINITTYQVSSGGYLYAGLESTTAIAFTDTIYVFGGENSLLQPINYWQYLQIPTLLPTNAPSNIPSDIPSQIPTNIPSDNPSKIPSMIPTDIPTNNIPDIPSKTPTVIVTDSGSIQTSTMPTNPPTTSTILYSISTMRSIQLSNDNNNADNATLWIVIIILIVIIGIIVIVTFFWLFKKRINKKTKNLSNVEMMSMDNEIQSNSIDKERIIPPGSPQMAQNNTLTIDQTEGAGGGMIIDNANNNTYGNNITIGNINGGGTVDEVYRWLDQKCGLNQYYSTFILNGYESLDIIKAIVNKSDLFSIGVTKIGHQTKIFSEIKKLNGSYTVMGHITPSPQ